MAAGGERRPGPDALLERGGELESIHGLIARVAGGEPQFALVEGPAGLGKTRLLGEIRAAALGDGMAVLSARASGQEREYPFGVVRQLFEPVVADPELREAALEGAASGAMTVFDQPAESGDQGADTSFTVLHGLHWLTRNLGSQRPLVIEIDDLHWVDRPSLRFLAYVLRRLENVPVLVAATLRSSEPGTDPGLLGEIVTDPATVPIRPGLLSGDAVLELVRDRLGDGASGSFGHACHEATGGNPLLLKQLLSSLAADGVAPDAANTAVVRDIGPRAVSRTVLLRLARLSDAAIAVARAVAVLGNGADIASVAAITETGEAPVAEVTADLVRAEILSPDPPLGFVHPLVLDAVYQDLAPGERELLHARAARVLRDAGAGAEHVSTHLLAMPARGDAAVADLLLEAGRSAARRGAPESSVTYMARALREPPPPERRAETLLALGLAEAQNSADDAATHLREARELLQDPGQRATAALVLAQTLVLSGHAAEAADICRTVPGELPDDLADLRLEFDALELFCVYFGEETPEARGRLREYRTRRPAGNSPAAKRVAAATVMTWMLENGPAADCVPVAIEALADRSLIDGGDNLFSVLAGLTLVLAERPEGPEAFDAMLATAHRHGLFSVLTAHVWRGWALIVSGDLAEAEQSQRDGLEEMLLWGSPPELVAYPAAFLALAQTERGDLEGAAAALARSGDPGAGPQTGHLWMRSRLELALAHREPEIVLAEIEEYRTRLAWTANAAWTPWASLKARALDQLDRVDEGIAAIEEQLVLARHWGAPGPIGHALRVLGSLQREDGLDTLAEAVDVLGSSVAKLERARALAAQGAALRRARQVTEAREPLRQALELATACAADSLAESVRSELYATGARPRTEAASGALALTTSERRVADLAAGGQTNRDIAQELFVTPKTVEVHLTSAYRKLGIKSRRQLDAALTAT